MPRDLLEKQPRDLLAGEAPQETFRDREMRAKVGASEALISMGANSLLQIPAGLAGIGAGLIPGGRTGAQAVEDVSSLAFQPKTQEGQGVQARLANLFAPIERGADLAGEVTGDPDDVLGATAVKTALLGAPAILGLRGLGGRSLGPSSTVPPKPKIPSVEQLKTAANQAYTRAENAGVIISKDSFSKFADNLRTKMANEGIDADLHPDAMAAMRRILADSDNNLTLKGADILRQVTQDASASIRPGDRRMAQIMRRELDDYIENLNKSDTLAGDSQIATQALTDARSLWSRARKGETLEKLVQRAGDRAGQFSGSGFENAIRTEFRQLALNEKRMRGFNKAEQDAIRRVARGGPVENAFRMVGKLAPTGVVSGVLGGSAGLAMFGPLGAIGLPAAGAGARNIATSLTLRNARKAAELARGGN